ncbi:glycosyltransferase family 2 protein [Yoonia sp.]|uniref:glycosyltransferase n=1 Tax=Yoonia sp. TaxID=2212373 RepID=UPI00273D5B3F|nr:glycosyltransferase [Yoonia sp.]
MDSITSPEDDPALAVLIPANNEAALIGDCLAAVAASRWSGGPVEVIVIPNGCTDNTAEIARAQAKAFSNRGWDLIVIERAEGGKLAALNAGDTAVRAGIRVYLDADVIVGQELLAQLHEVLNCDQPRYASGKVRMTAQSWVSRAYARIYCQVPFMAQGVPGCGVFAVNATGRARWGAFPQIISDDTYVRLQFTPEERIGVPAEYRWPVVEGLRNLIKVRRRQDIGVTEVATRFPELQKNEGKPALSTAEKLRMAAKDPVGFTIYTSVSLLGKLTRRQSAGWDRGR